MIAEYFIKCSAFFMYGIAVFLFIHFLNVSYVLDICIDWFLNDLKNDETYDFIIELNNAYFKNMPKCILHVLVGAGSAGITVASNLINAGYKIALIEAGGAPPWFADIPVLAPLFQQSPYDWKFKTVPQAHACKGLVNNQSVWPMGKILGGSSRLNYMAYVQGHPSDYQEWFSDYNNYVDRSKNFISENPRWCSELCDAILEGIQELSQKKFSSQNNENEDVLNFEKVKLTMIDGKRWSTDKLLSTKNSSGIKIITHAYVEKILFKSNTAKGVRFTKWKKHFNLFANEGVIVSAGTIGSPKLLMLSGIGPKHDLQKLKIKVIRDLPVGKNLMDHILTGIDLVVLNSSLSVSLPQLLKPKSIIDYFLFHQGPWTSAGIEVVGTVNKINKNFSIPPSIQFMIIPVGVSQDNGVVLRKAMGIKDELFQDYFAPLSHQTAITIAPVLLHPKSLGEVKLKSSNPFDDPIIDPQYLSHNDDILTLIEGIKLIKKLINTNAMKALGASIYNKSLPGCESNIFGSSEYWECYIRHVTLTSYHPVGTCRMRSVVDDSYRVLTTKKLYVIDASVMPELPSGNINAVVMMLADQAASLITNSKLCKKNQPKSFKKSCKNNIITEIFLLDSSHKNVCDIMPNNHY